MEIPYEIQNYIIDCAFIMKKNEKTDLYGEFSYLKTEDFDEDGINYDGLASANLMAGIKFKF